MKIIRLSQQEERESWLALRVGVITGTKAATIKPLSRGTDRTPQGFWTLLAEKLAIQADGEPPMDRGTRLENEAITIAADKLGIEFDLDPGFWISDVSPDIAVSPDAAEPGDKPTYDAEAKCLSSANHLKYVIKDIQAIKKEDYRPFNSVPSEYREQIVQRFIVNENLKTDYFVLYDDRVAVERLSHHVITVHRGTILEEIETQKQYELDTIKLIDELVKEFL